MSYFDRLHPAVAFFYLIAVTAISMLTMNPVLILISYAASVGFTGMLIGLRRLLASLAYSLPTAALIAVTNPLFVHRGKTVLFFLNDNPVTLEAILYGVFASLMIMSVFYWCRCYTEIMTADKFVYLFGGLIPKLSLILSLALAFIPKCKRRFREIDEAQKTLGVYATNGLFDRVRAKLRVFSILVTWSLEGSVETADSMRARGYGLGRRTRAAVWRLSAGDLLFLLFSLAATGALIVLTVLGVSDFSYYPALSAIRTDLPAYLLYAALVLLAGASILTEVKENVLWRILRSRI